MSVRLFDGFGGVPIVADVAGASDAPAVLLVHGAGQTREVWRTVASGLVAAGRQIVAIDLRGHGESGRPADGRYDLDAHAADLRAVLAQFDKRPVVVATALGAWIAVVALGAEAATLTAGLVLADLPPQADPALAHDVGRRLRATVGDWDPRVLDAIDLAGVPDRLTAAAPQLRVPVLLVRGAHDALASEAQSAAFAARIGDCEFASVEGRAALVTDDGADAFGAVLLDFLERRCALALPDYRAGSDPRTLRDALGCFATGVTIVTARNADGAPVGLTANSFTSVSLDPPLLLVCIANSAGSAPVLRKADTFGVNVLQIGQQPVSQRFAGKGEDRFVGMTLTDSEEDVPLIAGSLCAFTCQRHAVHDAGDHFLLIGEVVRAAFEPRRDPLLFFRGKYRRLHFA